MVVQHNLTAMNSNRMLGLTTKTQAKSTEKLSSGYKVNRAADDAAGLAISEKMRRQIRGLTQASLNAQDGISAVQTAEGALNEVHDMLQRMNELAVKAANGTNQSEDQSYIQSEVDALIDEINRVAETTSFNEKMLLNGSWSGGVDLQVGSEGTTGNRISVSIKSMDAAGISVDTLKNNGVTSQSDAQASISVIKSATDLSTPSITWTMWLRTLRQQKARSVIPIWLQRWLSTPTTIFWHRQARLCLRRLTSLTRVYCPYLANQDCETTNRKRVGCGQPFFL